MVFKFSTMGIHGVRIFEITALWFFSTDSHRPPQLTSRDRAKDIQFFRPLQGDWAGETPGLSGFAMPIKPWVSRASRLGEHLRKPDEPWETNIKSKMDHDGSRPPSGHLRCWEHSGNLILLWKTTTFNR